MNADHPEIGTSVLVLPANGETGGQWWPGLVHAIRKSGGNVAVDIVMFASDGQTRIAHDAVHVADAQRGSDPGAVTFAFPGELS